MDSPLPDLPPPPPEIVRLEASSLPRFGALFPPGWRPIAPDRLGAAGPVVAVGGLAGGWEPAGLAVAVLLDGANAATLNWLAVAQAYSGWGLANEVLDEIERLVASLGATTISAAFVDGRPSSPALVKIFARAGWTTPRLHLLQYEIDETRFAGLVDSTEQWATVPPDLRVVPWATLGPAEHESIRERERTEKIESWLWAYLDESATADVDTSVALVTGAGRVVGWLITRRVGPNAVLHDRVFVDRAYRGLGGSQILARAALVAQRSRDGDRSRVATRCHAANQPMLAINERVVAPHTSSIGRIYQVEKRLSRDA